MVKCIFFCILQLVPLVVASGLNFAGYQGRSKTWRYLVSGGMSFAWCALFVNSGITTNLMPMVEQGAMLASYDYEQNSYYTQFHLSEFTYA